MKCFWIFFHKYMIVGTEKWRDGDFLTTHTTLRLICQECGRIKTKDIDGLWNLEDFKKSNRMKTVSKDLAIKLRENGFPQENHTYYYDIYHIVKADEIIELYPQKQKENEHFSSFAAPIANELFDQLPWGVNLRKNKNNYCANYAHIPQSREHATNPADALAKLWLYLKEQSLISQKEKI